MTWWLLTGFTMLMGIVCFTLGWYMAIDRMQQAHWRADTLDPAIGHILSDEDAE